MSNERVLLYLSHFSVCKVGMESSNQIAPLYRKLASKGFSVVVSHPKKTRYIAEAKIKCDRVDSKAIAELVRLDALPLAYFPDGETAVLREKARRRAFLVRSRVKLRVKIKSVLTYEGLKWPSDNGLFTRKGVEWLHGLNLQPVESYLRVMETLDDEIMLLSKELRGMAEEDEDVKLLMTIPGIGYYTALLMKSEVGDVNRFPFGERLCSYAGLVPSTTSLFQSQINDKDNTISTLKTTNINLQNQVNVFTEILNLGKEDVWVNGQTVSQSANSYTGWTFEADTAGYVAVTVLTTTTNDTYVRVLYCGFGVDYDRQVTVHRGLQVNFPVLPSPQVEIRVGNTNTVDNATETVTITYWY
jgi:hypothetical protein